MEKNLISHRIQLPNHLPIWHTSPSQVSVHFVWPLGEMWNGHLVQVSLECTVQTVMSSIDRRRINFI